MPDILLNSYTIFIPKKKDTSEPANLRPISISLNLTRQFHEILCNRLTGKIKLSPNQYGFQKVYGVARGIDKLQAILRKVQTDLKPIAIAVLDLKKAFDSIAHQAFCEIVDKLEISSSLKSYLKFIYIPKLLWTLKMKIMNRSTQ